MDLRLSGITNIEDAKRAREEEIYSIRVNIIVTLVIIVRPFCQ